MLEIIKEVFIAQHRVDFRRGVFGMRAEMIKIDLDPYAGDCCVFIHPNHRQLRVLGGSSTGCWMLIKIFEAGALQKSFQFMQDPSFVQISKTELSLLIDGATLTSYSKVPDLVPCNYSRSDIKRSHEQEIKSQRQIEKRKTGSAVCFHGADLRC